MTRLAVLADIHGNLPAFEAVLADLALFDVDQVVVAGDIIHCGPSSAEVVRRVTAEGWPVIRGNHEYYLLDYGTSLAPPEWSDASQWGALAWLNDQISPIQRRAIGAWPDTLRLIYADASPIRVLHGSLRGNRNGIYPEATDASISDEMAGCDVATIIVAHTHLAMDRRSGSWRMINPGSVGVPFLGVHEASYAILDGNEHGWHVTHRRVPFDPEPILIEFDRQNSARAWGALGPLLVEEFATATMRIGAFLRWREALHPGTRITAELVDEFRTIDPWAFVPQPYHTARKAQVEGIRDRQ